MVLFQVPEEDNISDSVKKSENILNKIVVFFHVFAKFQVSGILLDFFYKIRGLFQFQVFKVFQVALEPW